MSNTDLSNSEDPVRLERIPRRYRMTLTTSTGHRHAFDARTVARLRRTGSGQILHPLTREPVSPANLSLARRLAPGHARNDPVPVTRVRNNNFSNSQIETAIARLRLSRESWRTQPGQQSALLENEFGARYLAIERNLQRILDLRFLQSHQRERERQRERQREREESPNRRSRSRSRSRSR